MRPWLLAHCGAAPAAAIPWQAGSGVPNALLMANGAAVMGHAEDRRQDLGGDARSQPAGSIAVVVLGDADLRHGGGETGMTRRVRMKYCMSQVWA